MLCGDKNEAALRYILPEGDEQIFAARYRLPLPREEELADELRREQTAFAQKQALENID